jgi:hypothetical protein
MEERIPAMLRALPILLLAGLGGCVYNPHQDFSQDYGESVHANVASQVVNPVPLRPSGPTINNGIRMNAAYQRYETGKVIRPEATQSLQGSSSSAGGGGGSPAGGGLGGGGGGSVGGSGGGSSPN